MVSAAPFGFLPHTGEGAVCRLLLRVSDGFKSSLHLGLLWHKAFFQVASLSYISRNTSVSQSNTFNTRPEVTVRCGR